MVEEGGENLHMVKKILLIDEVKKLVNSYKEILEKNQIPVEEIILFGSYAKGTAKPWSDIDLCVISEIFGQDGYEEMVKLKRLTSHLEPLIEPHPYSPKDMENTLDTLVSEIISYGKRVV